MKMTKLTGVLLLGLTSGAAFAAMGNAPSTYGVLPHDVATAQSLSLFGTQVSSVYYNPASLARDGRGELTGGIFHADHTLRAESLGGAAPAQRSGDVLDDTPSQQLLLGLKTDLSGLTTFRHPLYLGFMLGSERYAQEMLAFNAETSEFGQFLHYGRQPLFLSIGVGTTLWRGIDFGAALRLTLHSDATLYTETDLQGETRRERLDVTAEPVLRPILGLSVNMGETFCSVQDCWMDNLNFALGYRGYSNTRVRVDAEAEIPGTVTGPGLELAIRAIDSFQPEITSFGVMYEFGGRTRVGLSGEYQAWQRLMLAHFQRMLVGQMLHVIECVQFRQTPQTAPQACRGTAIKKNFALTISENRHQRAFLGNGLARLRDRVSRLLAEHVRFAAALQRAEQAARFAAGAECRA